MRPVSNMDSLKVARRVKILATYHFVIPRGNSIYHFYQRSQYLQLKIKFCEITKDRKLSNIFLDEKTTLADIDLHRKRIELPTRDC